MRYRKKIITLLSIILLTLPLSIYAQSLQQNPHLSTNIEEETSESIEEHNEIDIINEKSEDENEIDKEKEIIEEKLENDETNENKELEDNKETEENNEIVVGNESENKELLENQDSHEIESDTDIIDTDESSEIDIDHQEETLNEEPKEIQKEENLKETPQADEITNENEESKPTKQNEIEDRKEDETDQAIEPNILEDRMVSYERYFDAGGIKGGKLTLAGSNRDRSYPYIGIIKNQPIVLTYKDGELTGTSKFFRARLVKEGLFGGYKSDPGQVYLQYKLNIIALNENGKTIKKTDGTVLMATSAKHSVRSEFGDTEVTEDYSINSKNKEDIRNFVKANRFEAQFYPVSGYDTSTHAYAGRAEPNNYYTNYNGVKIIKSNIANYSNRNFGFGENLEDYVVWDERHIDDPAEFVGEPISSINYGKIDDSDDKDSYYLNLKTSFKPNASENFSLLAVNSPKDCDCQWKRYIVMDNSVAKDSDTITKEMKFKLGTEAPENHRYQVQYYLIDNSKIGTAKLSDLFDGERTDDHSKFQSLENKKDAIIAKSPVSTHYLTIDYAVKDAVIFEKNMRSEDLEYLDNDISYYLKLGFELESSYCFGVEEPHTFKIHLDLKNESIIAEEPVTNVILNTDIASKNLLNFTKIVENIEEGKHAYTFDLLVSLKNNTDLKDLINHQGTFSITSKIIKGEDTPIRSSYKEVDVAQQKSIYTYVIDEMEFPSVENIKSQRIFVDERPVMKTEAQLFQLEKFKKEFIDKNENFTFYKLAELKEVDEVLDIYGLNDEESEIVKENLSKKDIVQENPLYISFYIKGKLVDSQTHQLQFLLNELTREKVGDDYNYKYEGTAVFGLENKIMPREDNDIGLEGINPFLIYTKGFGDSHKITAKLEKKLEEGPRLELDLYIEIFSVDNFGFKNNDYPDTIYDKDDIRKITSEDINPLELDIATDNDFNGIAIIVRPIKDDNNKLEAMTKARYISDKPMKEGDLSQHNIKWTINSTLRTHE